MINKLDPPSLFDEVCHDKQIIMLNWIYDKLQPISTYNDLASSYKLKHLMEKDIGFYVSNGELKGAMLKAGYKPKNVDEQNWYFKISKKSSAFKKAN